MSGMRMIGVASACAVALAVSSVQATTLAYWNFDTNTLGTQAPNLQVPHATGGGIYDGTTPDVSGSGNALSVWDTSGAGFAYRADHPTLSGNPTNAFSIKNTGGGPAAFHIDRNGLGQSGSNTPTSLTTSTFAAWTVEVSYKPETGNFRTVVGRDARNVATSNPDFAAMYLQLQPNNRLVISYADVSGFFHEAATAPGFADPYDFNFPTDNEGATGQWMNIAATNNGSLLTLYVGGVQVAQTDLTLSGSPNTALAKGVETNTTDDWYAGGFTVGRGLYAGGHGDRAYGFIDDVRISDVALAPNQLLAAVPEPTTATVGLIALAGLAARKRRA